MSDTQDTALENPTIESVDGEVFTLARARKLAKRMYLYGFAFLPWLWFTNVWLFWHEFRGRPGADPEIKRHTRLSAACFTVTSLIFLPWFLLYIIAGEKVLSYNVWRALDATRLDTDALGFAPG